MADTESKEPVIETPTEEVAATEPVTEASTERETNEPEVSLTAESTPTTSETPVVTTETSTEPSTEPIVAVTEENKEEPAVTEAVTEDVPEAVTEVVTEAVAETRIETPTETPTTETVTVAVTETTTETPSDTVTTAPNETTKDEPVATTTESTEPQTPTKQVEAPTESAVENVEPIPEYSADEERKEMLAAKAKQVAEQQTPNNYSADDTPDATPLKGDKPETPGGDGGAGGGLSSLLNSLDGIMDDMVSPEKEQFNSIHVVQTQAKPKGNRFSAIKRAAANVVNSRDEVRSIAAEKKYNAQLKKAEEAKANLPPGWEMGETPEGKVYYIDHENETTSWKPPPREGDRDRTTSIFRRNKTKEPAEKDEAGDGADKPRQERSGSIFRRKKKTKDEGVEGDEEEEKKGSNRFSLFGKADRVKDEDRVEALASGWFIKKGKGKEGKDDHRKRYFELVDTPEPAIHYYTSPPDNSRFIVRKGSIQLTEGFQVQTGAVKLVIYTPKRTWMLEGVGETDTHQWAAKLEALATVHELQYDADINEEAVDDTITILGGWFTKKGKIEDKTKILEVRHRYFRLVGPDPVIHYYRRFTGGVYRDHKGSVDLAEGFHVETPISSGKTRLLLIQTPTRKWTLETDDDKQCQEWKKMLLDIQQERNIKYTLPGTDVNVSEYFEQNGGRIGGWFNKKGKGGPMVNDYKVRYCEYKQGSNEIEYFAALRNGVPKTLKGSIELHGGFDVSRETNTLFVLTTEGTKRKSTQRKWKLIACEEDGSTSDMDALTKRALVWETVLLSKRTGLDSPPVPVASTSKNAPVRPAPPPSRPPPPGSTPTTTTTATTDPTQVGPDEDTEDEDEEEKEGEAEESDDESEDEALPTYNNSVKTEMPDEETTTTATEEEIITATVEETKPAVVVVGVEPTPAVVERTPAVVAVVETTPAVVETTQAVVEETPTLVVETPKEATTPTPAPRNAAPTKSPPNKPAPTKPAPTKPT